MSSVATLGKTDNWLKNVFFKALDGNNNNSNNTKSSSHKAKGNDINETPKYSIIFPTADEIRRSLNGYSSGGSIHMKLQTATQQSQLQYIRPYLCQWAGDYHHNTTNKRERDDDDGHGHDHDKHNAGRRRAAPHIKTYIRFTDAEKMDSIDWAMVTSANLSTQAWGNGVNPSGEVFVSSWEIGVVVWPDLFLDYSDNDSGNDHVDHDDDGIYSKGRGENDNDKTDESKKKKVVAKMVPCFKHDRPVPTPRDSHDDTQSVIVGFRMPYDLPLTPYESGDVPWSHPIQSLTG